MIEIPKSNLIDRAIKYFNPVKAHQRLRARFMLAATESYTGASKSRRPTMGWMPKTLDADSALLPQLSTLVNRSRDLLRNCPLAVGAVNTATTNIVGTGLKLQARIDREALKMADEEAEAWEAKTEREWNLWSESQNCDVARTLSFGLQQDLILRQVLEAGDIFVLMTSREYPGWPYSLALQIVEGDRVCNQNNISNSETLAGGVEKDAQGAPIRYHIRDQHPGYMLANRKFTWTIVPAFAGETGLRNVIHLYKVLRPGQSRGVPYLAPVIETLKQLDRYTEAELMAAVIAGMFTVFIKSESGGMGLASMTGDANVDSAKSPSDEDIKMSSGAIIGLRTGESIETADPGRPTTAFDPFVKAILQQVGVALEIPFEVLIGHFSASYSASRAALLEAWRFFLSRRDWLAQNLCQVIYETWLWEAVASGRISALGFFKDAMIRKAYCGALWEGDAPSQIDPIKEADGAEKRINLGLSTVDRETRALCGGDFEKNLPRIRKERKLLEEIGLWIPEGKKATPGLIQKKEKPPKEEEEGEEDENS